MKQEINCNVKSCKFNNQNNGICQLQAILVSSVNGKVAQKPDESMCASYRCAE